MLTKLTVKNFRSIEACDVEFAPITIFFGPTSAGKSTLFYSLLALRNLILNPNQAADGLFNFGFQNLGGFDACVFNHEALKQIEITSHFDRNNEYGILRKSDADLFEESEFAALGAKVPVPYGVNQSWPFSIVDNGDEYTINWNGFASTVAPKAAAPTPEPQARAVEIAAALNGTVEAIKRIDICPHRRGFFKPNYSSTPLTPTPTSEDEVATLIINDQNAPPRISINTVEIFRSRFPDFHTPWNRDYFLANH